MIIFNDYCILQTLLYKNMDQSYDASALSTMVSDAIFDDNIQDPINATTDQSNGDKGLTTVLNNTLSDHDVMDVEVYEIVDNNFIDVEVSYVSIEGHSKHTFTIDISNMQEKDMQESSYFKIFF